MKQEELQAGFDEWAQTYDEDVRTTEGFPFAGYERNLALIWEEARAKPGMPVLDLGIGTGNLARLFVAAGCEMVGADFSAEMLAKTAKKLPRVALVQADLTRATWPEVLERRFECIVSNYVFHEFPLETKIAILERLARDHLARDGRIVIGDIVFPTSADLDRARVELGDEWEEEFYWATDEARAALEPAGWAIEHTQTSFCAGVYVFTPPPGVADTVNRP